MEINDFFDFIGTKDRKFELVDGEPVMRYGTNQRHQAIATNTLVALRNQPHGRRCRPFISNLFVRIPSGNLRIPDLGVDCGALDSESFEASEPALVVEILPFANISPDRKKKIEDFKSVASIEDILLIDPDRPQVRRFHRTGADRKWSVERIIGLKAIVELPVLGLRLSLFDIYEGLTIRSGPIISGGDAPANTDAF